jgi:Flp pilus assembly protein TadG
MVKNHARRRGAAAVEFGLLLVPLVLILLGIIDYGWAFLQASQVKNAAREGARAAAVGEDGASAADLYLTQAGMLEARSTAITTTADRVTAAVTYDFSPLVGFVPLPDQLTGQVSMRLETGP